MDNKIKNVNKYMEFEKRVFSEMRGVIVEQDTALSEENLVKAITLNENLNSLGFCFNAVDLVKLAKSSTLDTLFEKLKGFMPEVKAKPMYPDFPSQVMEMDEAVFRFHQLVHYFSTYGMEFLFGVEVKHGWLPEVKETKKDEFDKKLFPDKTLKVYSLEETYEYINTRIAGKTERLTEPEVELVRYMVLDAGCKVDEIPFKENIGTICYNIVAGDDLDVAFRLMRALCKHTGDVLRLLRMYMGRRHYKPMPTSRKRMFVRLLESYPVYDLEENLWPSNRLYSKEVAGLLDTLSYNRFSRSTAHAEVVKGARDGKLKSWKGKVEEKLKSLTDENVSDVLTFIGSRPGEFFRMMVRLFRLGISKDLIIAEAMKHADKFRPQMLLATMTMFEKKVADEKNAYNINEEKLETLTKEHDFIKEACVKILKEMLSLKETPLKDKKVFVDKGIYDFKHSIIETNDKSQEGGYIRSGLAFAIPEDISVLRFFVYWNDKQRIDIDLHSYGIKTNGEMLHIGWNGEFRNASTVFSGDITHSDAAEFIDVDLEKAKAEGVSHIYNNIRSFTRVPFKKIDTVFTGMMGVSKLGINKNMKLHTIKNEFFHHELNTEITEMAYSLIDIQEGFMRITAKEEAYASYSNSYMRDSFSLEDYLSLLLEAQNVTMVETKEDADIVLTLDKPKDENGLSLIDENYFLE